LTHSDTFLTLLNHSSITTEHFTMTSLIQTQK